MGFTDTFSVLKCKGWPSPLHSGADFGTPLGGKRRSLFPKFGLTDFLSVTIRAWRLFLASSLNGHSQLCLRRHDISATRQSLSSSSNAYVPCAVVFFQAALALVAIGVLARNVLPIKLGSGFDDSTLRTFLVCGAAKVFRSIAHLLFEGFRLLATQATARDFKAIVVRLESVEVVLFPHKKIGGVGNVFHNFDDECVLMVLQPCCLKFRIWMISNPQVMDMPIPSAFDVNGTSNVVHSVNRVLDPIDAGDFAHDVL